jgi:hypothetical protein
MKSIVVTPCFFFAKGVPAISLLADWFLVCLLLPPGLASWLVESPSHTKKTEKQHIIFEYKIVQLSFFSRSLAQYYFSVVCSARSPHPFILAPRSSNHVRVECLSVSIPILASRGE